MTDKQPQVNLTPEQVICDRHGEVFRESWPAGYSLFVVGGMRVVMEMLEFQKLVRGKFSRVEKLLRRRPICCRLPRDEILGLYETCCNNTDFGAMSECMNCGNLRLGTPYRTRNPATRAEHHYTHICFECVLDNLAPLETN